MSGHQSSPAPAVSSLREGAQEAESEGAITFWLSSLLSVGG